MNERTDMPWRWSSPRIPSILLVLLFAEVGWGGWEAFRAVVPGHQDAIESLQAQDAQPTTVPTDLGPIPADALWVASDGNDDNAGSHDQPIETLQRAIDLARPGITIVVKPGTYHPTSGANAVAVWDPAQEHGEHGTADAPIVVRAQFPASEVDPTQRTVLRGEEDDRGLIVNAVDHPIIDGFEFTNFEVALALLNATDYTTHARVTRNVFRSNTTVGVQCYACDDALIADNHFLDPGPAYDPDGPETKDAVQDYGVQFIRGGSRNQVVNNVFSGKHNQALSFKSASAEGLVAHNTFEGCMYTCVYLGQDADVAEQDQTSRNLTVEYNTFRDATDPETDAYYRLRSPVTIENVNGAIVRHNNMAHFFYTAVRVLPCRSANFCQHASGLQPVGAQIYGNVIADPVVRDPSNGQNGYDAALEIHGRGYADDVIEIYDNTIENVGSVFRFGPVPDFFADAETSNMPTIIFRDNVLVNTPEPDLSLVAP